MEVLRNLFEGYPNLWGGGVAHSVLILSLTIAFGIILAKIKVRGVSLGVTWILFVGIVFGHFNMNLDEHLLHFLKEFRIDSVCLLNWFAGRTRLFFSIQKGGLYPEYASYARSSIRSNHYYYPALHHRNSDYHNGRYFVRSRHQYSGLGAAQQANSDLNGIDAPEIALGYAVSLSAGCSRYHPFPACFEISSFASILLKKKKKQKSVWDISRNLPYALSPLK